MDNLIERLRDSFFLINVEAADEIELLQKSVAELEAEKSTIVANTVERCAKICDDRIGTGDKGIDTHALDQEAWNCAKAIRAITKE